MLNAASQRQLIDGSLGHASAIRAAWTLWIGLGTLPMLCLLYLVYKLTVNDPSSQKPDHTDQWFLGVSIYLMVVVPAAFFVQSSFFRRYWKGHPVPPRQYLLGMASVWTALSVGGLLSLIGCTQANSLLPNMIPAAITFVFFISQWPDGRAMTHRVGNSHDASVYKEPR